ncbi:MAG: bifunctional UDP-N-acetylglucosamine diphosphorylase/glucosamine-1-phosphate N-acetyltransferase GlmU [Nakamurella sp.]
MPQPDVTVIVLAAGAGTRMRSATPKVMHPIAGRPLVWHALAAAAGITPTHLVAVLGHGREQVTGFLATATDLPPVISGVQEQQLGTGHAAACGLDALRARIGTVSGTVIVTSGDTPLLRAETLELLARTHADAGNAVTVLTATVADPTGYGRIVREADGTVSRIVEHRDADDEQRAIREINSSVYAFDAAVLVDTLPRVGTSNSQGEQYLTDVLALARADGHRVGAVIADDAMETEGVNDRAQLAALARVLNDRIVRRHQLAGVTILDPVSTWIDADVTIGADSVLEPGVQLKAGTSIGRDCRIGPDTTLSGCTLGDDVAITRSHCIDARVGDGADVGPFAYLRPQTVLHHGAHVGAHVEIKKSTIGPGAKVPHLTYLGDAEVGAGSNIGAGVITANYDGVHKFPTVIGEHVFVGTNSTLVAPVTLADGSYVAAGSTVTQDVAAGDLAVARGRQHHSRGWVLRRRADSRYADAARRAGAGNGAEQPAGQPDGADDKDSPA